MRLTHKFNVDRVVIDPSYLKAGLQHNSLRNPLTSLASSAFADAAVAHNGLTLGGATADNSLVGIATR